MTTKTISGSCPTSFSEDCLFLTITSPRSVPSNGQKYPVLFWIHGGSYVAGAGDVPLYNATHFAINNIVTVVINYRIGILGYLASAAMSGNYGIKDQRMALQWTKTNIAAFGGDPNSITIAGESAGAISVGIHLVSPSSQGLFTRAIMQSNPFGIPLQNRVTAAITADGVSTYLGCESEDVSCLRSKSVDAILSAQANAVDMSLTSFFSTIVALSPMVDSIGDIPEQPALALSRKGIDPSIQVLSGYNKDEGILFVYSSFESSINSNYYQIAVKSIFKDFSSQVSAVYPSTLIPGNSDGRAVLSVMATDAFFHCPLRNVTKAYQVSSRGAQTTYLYQFNHVLSFKPWGGRTYCYNASCHAAELPMVFNTFSDAEASLNYTPSSSERVLAYAMHTAWSNFIKNGNPSTGGSISPLSFPAYAASTDILSIVDVQNYATTTALIRDSYCDLWDSIGFEAMWFVDFHSFLFLYDVRVRIGVHNLLFCLFMKGSPAGSYEQ